MLARCKPSQACNARMRFLPFLSMLKTLSSPLKQLLKSHSMLAHTHLLIAVQVNRETKTDCALAELYTKSNAVEQILQEQKQADIFTKLYVRMNEVCGELHHTCWTLTAPSLCLAQASSAGIAFPTCMYRHGMPASCVIILGADG